MTRQDDPRRSYITIATRNFAANGYHGSSLAAVARDAGVTKQALLHFFGTKDRLYAAVLTDLADRLCAEIDAVADPDPVEHLRACFAGLHRVGNRDAHDARLVVRALLDSDSAARQWPMKPYLDRLVALVRATPRGREMTSATALAWVFQQIGMAQYLAISGTAISAMYGAQAQSEVADQMAQLAEDAVESLSSGGSG